MSLSGLRLALVALAALPLIGAKPRPARGDDAARCVALGVGRAIEAKDVTPETVRAAARAVLGASAYRRNAEQFQREIRELPGPEYAVAELERLVTGVTRIPLAS